MEHEHTEVTMTILDKRYVVCRRCGDVLSFKPMAQVVAEEIEQLLGPT